MNKMQAWARLLMGLVGLLGLLSLLTEGWSTFSVLVSWMRAEKHEFPLLQYVLIIAGHILLVLRIVIIYQLLVRGKRWAPRLVGFVKDEPGGRDGFPIAAAFRLAAFACGVLVLFWTVPDFLHTIYAVRHNEAVNERLLTVAIRMILAVYLICGAPHVARWQAGRALEDTRIEPTEGE